MPKIQNISPLGDLDVPLLRRAVEAGEVVDVSDDHAELLLAQTGAWAPVAGASRSRRASSTQDADDSAGDDASTGDDQ